MKKNRSKTALTLGLIGVLLVCLPLVGAFLGGRPIRPFLTLTAEPVYAPAAPFSWPVFLLLGAALLLCLAPFLGRLVRGQGAIKEQGGVSGGSLPWWGRLGLILFVASWVLAWTRFSWFAAFQAHTFEPLWLSFIVVVNGCTHKRTGACLLTRAPVYLCCLFAASPFFWWFFEYLNRFAANWHYAIGPGEPTVLKAHASLAFSTVLPGVASVCELLGSFPRARAGMDRFAPFDLTRHPRLLWLVLLFAATGLAGVGGWPELWFPALWVSPLLLVVAIQAIAGYDTIFAPVRTGDWTHLWLMAASALVCGFFWELWNVFSLAHWEYAVPYVGRFRIFEMPLLGYGGYLPFGLECAVVCDGVRRCLRLPRREPAP